MTSWTVERAREKVFRFDNLSEENKKSFLSILNKRFPAEIVEDQAQRRKKALDNLALSKNILSNVKQSYPECIARHDSNVSAKDLAGYAILLTAGGEGERLYHSLVQQGMNRHRLSNFTKVTFPLPDFHCDFGTLHVNLSLISKICRKHAVDIPVIVTTGPKESITAHIIPSIIKDNNSFYLKNLKIIMQEERIHFTEDEKIAYTLIHDKPRIITNPDETGGPLMKLKKRLPDEPQTALQWLMELGCNKIILLQATALYDPSLIPAIASAGKKYDGLGVGIQRNIFPQSDPYGTYVLIEQNKQRKLIIAEMGVRNNITMSIMDNDNTCYLPFNTGFYVFDITLIQNNTLPDYATPPKELLPGLPKSPKTGYAATDMITFAGNPAVLLISQDSYGVIKNAGDLKQLSNLGKKLGLDKICKEMNRG